MVRIRRIKAIATLGFIFLLSVVIIFFAGFFNTTAISVAYAKPNQMSHNLANSIDIPSIPAKKVHVTDIDIAYKTFGKGEPFLLISGSGLVMDAWESSILKNLSSTVVLEIQQLVSNHSRFRNLQMILLICYMLSKYKRQMFLDFLWDPL